MHYSSEFGHAELQPALQDTLEVLRRELRVRQTEVARLANAVQIPADIRERAVAMREPLIQELVEAVGTMAMQQDMETKAWPFSISPIQLTRGWLSHKAWCILPKLIAWDELCLRSCVESIQNGQHSEASLLPEMQRIRGELDALLSLKRRLHRVADPVVTIRGWL